MMNPIEHEAPEEDAFNYIYKIDNREYIFFVKDAYIKYRYISGNVEELTVWLDWPAKKEYFLAYLQNPFITKLGLHNRFINVPPMPILSKLEKKIKLMHKRSNWGQKQEGVAYV